MNLFAESVSERHKSPLSRTVAGVEAHGLVGAGVEHVDHMLEGCSLSRDEMRAADHHDRLMPKCRSTCASVFNRPA